MLRERGINREFSFSISLSFHLCIGMKRECLDDVKKKKKKEEGCKYKIARMDKVIEKRRTTRRDGSWKLESVERLNA